ncbi:ferritin-like domain-containing protein [Terriglobus sp.]|uniref:ferritin-like domain-containing protein n=1 Tax=Terriglobus sp. TaxID=1889013 RepID=UPI003AFFAB60
MSDLMNHLETCGEGEISLTANRRASALRDRRGFLSTLGLAGAALGAGAMTGCSTDGPISLPGTTPSVLDVLNFALNLEYLEASFYSYVTTGAGLPAADMGGSPGTVTGGAKVTFTNPIVASLANQLATHERQHVELLRASITSIGGTPVAMPAINLAANGAVTNDATFLAAARQLESVGVSAYAGGAQYLVSSVTALNYAAQILHAEAQHAGFLRELCIVNGISSPAVDSLDQVPSLSKIFNTDATTGLNPVRTTSQVLQIVYGSVGTLGVTKGGFFPNGLNGAITIS